MPVELERPKFLVDLLAEVDAFEAVYSSHDPIAAGETACGTLAPWLRRAYSLARYYAKQMRHLQVDREDDGPDAEIAEMKCKADLLVEIMWSCVRAERGLWSDSNVGVRENFTVIRSAVEEDDDGLTKLLLKMFRGK